jgi:NADH:ubiquinone oxidoreductase subunit 2 (subunit N)
VAELAFGLPAAGAILVSLLRRRRALPVLTGLAFGAAGLVATALIVPGGQGTFFGLQLEMPAAARVVLLGSFVAAGLVVLLVPPGADRTPMLASVLVGLSALAALAVVVEPMVTALVLLLLAAVQSALPALRPFSDRVRAPAFGALLVALGALLATGAAGATSTPILRVSGLALVLGVAAAIGVAPYLQALDPREPAPASPIAWLAFIGPGLAVVLATRLIALLPAEAGAAYAGVLVALGLFNLALGSFGAWRSRSGADLWRYSFLGDWGLVLVGLGLLQATGAGGAYLLLLTVLLLRLPLYLLARPALITGKPVEVLRPLTLLVAAALFGAAPFAGFAARLLILRAATGVSWALTAVLVLAMLSWLPPSLRLAQTLGRPTGRLAFGVGVVTALNLALGLYPKLVLNLVGVR